MASHNYTFGLEGRPKDLSPSDHDPPPDRLPPAREAQASQRGRNPRSTSSRHHRAAASCGLKPRCSVTSPAPTCRGPATAGRSPESPTFAAVSWPSRVVWPLAQATRRGAAVTTPAPPTRRHRERPGIGGSRLRQTRRISLRSTATAPRRVARGGLEKKPGIIDQNHVLRPSGPSPRDRSLRGNGSWRPPPATRASRWPASAALPATASPS